MKLDIDDSGTWVYSPICTYCLHWVGIPGKRKCKAFEDIPIEIWTGLNNHTKPYEGDHGVQFEKSDDE